MSKFHLDCINNMEHILNKPKFEPRYTSFFSNNFGNLHLIWFGGFILKHVVTFCKKPECFILLCSSDILLTDGRTDGQTDGRTDGRTDMAQSISLVFLIINIYICPYPSLLLLCVAIFVQIQYMWYNTIYKCGVFKVRLD